MKRWLGLIVNRFKRGAIQAGFLLLAAGLSAFVTGCEPQYVQSCPPTADCDPLPDTPPTGVNTCDLSTFDPDLIGICIPHVDAGWHTALVKMAFPDEGPLQCPESAQWAGLLGQEITDPATEPRNVIGCSVNPLATCSSLSWACVPFETDFSPCVLQTNQDVCPDPYLFQTKVTPKGGGATATVCCTRPEID